MEADGLTLSKVKQIDFRKLLKKNYFFDYSDAKIGKIVSCMTDNAGSVSEKAVKLFEFVRDEVQYSMHVSFFPENVYKASYVLSERKGFCIQKAVLLAAMLRCAGIPAVLGFADIVNYAVPKDALDFLGTNVFPYHGFVLLKTEAGWIKATPTFDRKTCEKTGYPLVVFDGISDAVFPQFFKDGKKFVEYVKFHGYFLGVPLKDVIETWKDVYGKEKVNPWVGKSD